jgi:hypothetical protein
LSTIQFVDSVIVIGKKGNIIEQGNISYLMNQRGVFNHLYHLQLSGFHQFFQYLTKLVKISLVHNRRLSVGLFSILIHNHDVQNLHFYQRFLNDLNTTFEFIVRESDIIAYEPTGKWWLAFPETTHEEGLSICYDLYNYVKNVKHEYGSNTDISMFYNVIQVTHLDSEESIIEKLNSNVYETRHRSIF